MISQISFPFPLVFTSLTFFYFSFSLLQGNSIYFDVVWNSCLKKFSRLYFQQPSSISTPCITIIINAIGLKYEIQISKERNIIWTSRFVPRRQVAPCEAFANCFLVFSSLKGTYRVSTVFSVAYLNTSFFILIKKSSLLNFFPTYSLLFRLFFACNWNNSLIFCCMMDIENYCSEISFGCIYGIILLHAIWEML